ncbi:hypothetical protein [Longispora urticae]
MNETCPGAAGRETVLMIVTRAGVTPRGSGERPRLFDHLLPEMAARYRAGESKYVISQALGIEQGTVNGLLYQAGLAPMPPQ